MGGYDHAFRGYGCVRRLSTAFCQVQWTELFLGDFEWNERSSLSASIAHLDIPRVVRCDLTGPQIEIVMLHALV